MNPRRENALALLPIAIGFCLTACGDQASQIPPDSFRATEENLVEESDLLVKHVIIEAAGARTVKITYKGGHVEVIIEPAPDQKLMLADVTFVMALVDTSDSANRSDWLVQIKGEGVRGAQRPSFQVEAESLADVLELEFEQQLYPLGQDIVIGNFQGEPFVISVK